MTQTPFPAILLDDGPADSWITPDRPELGRIWNIFSENDLHSLKIDNERYPPVLRLYDLGLLGKLSESGVNKCPVILSHLIDLEGKELPEWSAGLAVEVANHDGLDIANTLECDLVIGRGFETPGPSRECSSFVLFQLLSRKSRHPYYMTGNTGYELFQAYLALGASGIVLHQDHFNQDTTGELYRFPLHDSANLRLRIKGGALEAANLRDGMPRDELDFVTETFAKGLWSSQSGDLLDKKYRRNLDQYIQLWELSPREVTPDPCFYKDCDAAKQLGTTLPVIQGAMANVSLSPAFAKAVYDEGALSCLALAGQTVEYACQLLQDTAGLNIPFGAGIVSVSVSDEELEAIIACLEETSPTLVVLATPQLDHVQRFLQTDLNVAVHAPNGAMFSALLEMGVRTFIIEGEEAGGHVSRISSLSAWQEVLNEIRKRRVENDVHLILAGGIYDQHSSSLITHLLNFYGLADKLKVSLQMGSAYLSTIEAVNLTALPPTYQQLLIDLNETIVTGETLNRNVRQLATPAIRELLEKEWTIFSSDDDLESKKYAFEVIYQGSHSRAVNSDELDPSASYMAGSVATLIDKASTIKELHNALIPEQAVPADITSDENEPIAIVGIGIRIPGADSAEEHFRNLLLKRCFIRDIPDVLQDKPDRRFKRDEYLTTDPDDKSRCYVGLAGLIESPPDDLSRFRIPPKTLEELADAQIIALLSAQRAMDDAGFFHRPIPTSRIAAFVGVNGDMNEHRTRMMVQWNRIREELLALPDVDEEQAQRLAALFDQYEATHYDEWNYDEDKVTGKLASLVASRISNVFDLGGITNTVDAACASGLAAIAQAVSMLREKQCDAALAGAIGLDLGPDAFTSFSSLSTLSPNGSFPFDARADGFVIGEGGGLFFLKRKSDAVRHGDRIYALIHGWGASSDGAGKGITAPNYKGQIQAVKQAYSRCEIGPGELDFLECHATGTPVGDAEERMTAHKAFGEARANANEPPLPIGGSKAVTGHLLSGAGVVSMLSAVAAINLQRVPPQVNFEETAPDIDLESLGLKVAKRPEVIKSPIVHAGVSSFGFGGVNYHMVLSSPERNRRPPVLDSSIADFPRFDNLEGDIAFLLPGQGSQYPGMLHGFKDNAEAMDLLSRGLSIFKEFSDAPLEELLLVDPSADEDTLQPYLELLKATRISQPAIFLTSAIMLSVLQKKGIKPAMAIGHSLGEHSALYASGMLGFDDAFRIVCIRGQLMSTPSGGDSGAMAALACGEKHALEILDAVDGYATCANYNSYQQTVISGDTSAIDEVILNADSKGVRAYKLPVERGFHSQLVADCEGPMVQALAECSWNNGSIPVLANVSRQAYPFAETTSAGQPMSDQDKHKAQSLLAGLIPLPVDFISQVNTAYEAGIRRFVEVGPKNILTRLVDQILQGKPFQTESVCDMSDLTTTRIEDLAAQLKLPLTIKRQPLPTRKKVTKAKPRQVATATGKLEPIDQIRLAVSEVSGYAPEQIDDNAEFERDLGIDTLKIFEILSRLRGSVLPQQVENFRHLTSVSKILAAADPSLSTVSETKPDRRETEPDTVSVYHYRTNIVDYVADATSSQASDSQVVIEALPTTMAEISDDLLPKLHRMLRDYCQTHADSSTSRLKLVTYAAEQDYYDGAFFALTAFLKSVQKDIPNTTFSYIHFDGEKPSKDTIGNYPEPPIGTHVRADGKIIQSQLNLMDEVFGEHEQLPGLLTDRDVVLVTGGARGVTAEITKSLIRNTNARFIILGRKPQTEDWIKEIGEPRVEYLSVDLLDTGKVSELNLGRHGITLLIHGAGIEVSKNICNKSEEEFAHVIGTKVGGLRHILSQLEPDKLRGVIQFSSVVSYVGNNGQADYAAANGVLNGTLPEGIPALSIAWDAWDEVGMATRGVVKEIFETQGVSMIPLDVGTNIFERLLSGFLLSPPKGTIKTAVFGTRSHSELNDGIMSPTRQPVPVNDYLLSDPESTLELETKVDLNKHSVLKDHSFGGNVVTPACVMMRQFIVTALKERCSPDPAITFKHAHFLAPLALRHNETINLKVSRHGDNFNLGFQEEGESSAPIMQTQLRVADTQGKDLFNKELVQRLLDTSGIRHTPFELDLLPLHISTGMNHFGPEFEVLNNVSYNGQVLRGEVNMEKAKTGNRNLLTDTGGVAYLVEAIFFVCTRLFFINVWDDLIRIVKSFESCTVFPDRCESAREAIVYAEHIGNKDEGHFDGIIVDENNQPLVILEKYQTGLVGKGSLVARRPLPQATPFNIGNARILISDLTQAATWAETHSCLNQEEQSELAKLNSQKRRSEKLAGKLVAKLLAHSHQNPLEKYGPEDLQRYQVLTDGTPVDLTYDNQALTESPYFSISHTNKIVCAAQADAPIGVDIEEIRPLSDKTIEDICGETLLKEIRNFQDREWTWVDDPEVILAALPVLIFTQKEAVLKAAGIGLAEGLDEVEIDEIAFNREIHATHRGKSYRVTSTFNNEHVISVAIKEQLQDHDARNDLKSLTTPATLSLLQEPICHDEKEGAVNNSYTLTHLVHLDGKIDTDSLKSAIDSINQEHDVLRMGFDNQCAGFIRSRTEVPYNEIQLDKMTASEADEQVKSLLDELVATEYDLEKDILYSALLITLPGNKSLLAINFHHAIMDCFCSFDYSNTLITKYRSIIQNESQELIGDVPQYNKFALRQREHLTTERQDKIREYWTSQFSDATPIVFPPCAQAKQGLDHTRFTIEHDALTAVEAYCQRNGVTLFIGILSAMQVALMHWLKRTEMTVSVPFSLRDRVKDVDILGPFVNLLPIRHAATQDRTWTELSQELRATLFGAIDHHDTPPTLLQDIFKQDKDNNKPLTRVICQLIYKPEAEISIPGLDIERGVIDGHNNEQALVFSFYRNTSDLSCEITRNTALVDKSTVDRLISEFRQYLGQMCEFPDARVEASISKDT